MIPVHGASFSVVCQGCGKKVQVESFEALFQLDRVYCDTACADRHAFAVLSDHSAGPFAQCPTCRLVTPVRDGVCTLCKTDNLVPLPDSDSRPESS